MTQQQRYLQRDIENSLHNAEAHAARLKFINSCLVVASIVASAATTLVTSMTAARGATAGAGPVGWKLSCLIAAGFGFATTVCVAMQQQLRLSDRLAKANECAGRLKSLAVAVTYGRRDMAEIAADYGTILTQFPAAVRAVDGPPVRQTLTNESNLFDQPSKSLPAWKTSSLTRVSPERN